MSTHVRKQPVGWDATLAVELIIVTAFGWVTFSILLAVVLLGYRALAFPNLPNPGAGVVMACLAVAASALSGQAVGRWRNGRAHSGLWLTLAAVLGSVVAALAVKALQPWPDLLSDEVATGGQSRFLLMAGKTWVPWLAAALAAFGILRCDPWVRHKPQG